VSIARYTTIVAAFLTVSQGLLRATLGGVLEANGGKSLLLGGGLAALNTCTAYFLARWSATRSNRAFLMAILGGMTARMAVMLAVVAIAALGFGLPQLPLIVSLLGYFAVFLAFELAVLWRSPAVQPVPR
jgi:hypothetical protein